MSLGLPSHLARPANSRAIATAARWAGLVCLGGAVLNVATSSLGSHNITSWLTLLFLVPMVALLLMLARGRTVVLTLAYLIVGAVCTYFYVVALLTTTPSYRDTNLFVIALPVVAMTLVGGTGTGSLVGILWATLGFALAEAAVILAAATAERSYVPDAISLGAYLLLVGVLAFDGLTRGTRSRAQAALHRAVRDARLVDIRRELTAASTAELHDTVLSELVAVASVRPGELEPRLARRIEADLRGLAVGVPGEDGSGSHDFAGAGETAGATAADPWYDSELHQAIETARDEGLTVDVSGDRTAFTGLDEDVRRAVGLAVRQCLVNVMRHSGSPVAEVALSAGGGSVSVMVVDSGSGFPAAGPAADRLGLRQSVQDRIARVGGTVDIYSSTDVGTTVILTVPAESEHAAGGGPAA
ncbi:ATP-binding protein [Leifsonia sp. C5G2]|uniref:sensor histidine kinase n=1 Tax=Leifsonia sp. C5G2 TaxID=2735269 RepID=UPI0015844B7A|nr:ATP-binding protein [Leifsonia sp. C5G2]NUU04894.1 ATP-binding protein [Leifsonia sp. C5G2]